MIRPAVGCFQPLGHFHLRYQEGLAVVITKVRIAFERNEPHGVRPLAVQLRQTAQRDRKISFDARFDQVAPGLFHDAVGDSIHREGISAGPLGEELSAIQTGHGLAVADIVEPEQIAGRSLVDKTKIARGTGFVESKNAAYFERLRRAQLLQAAHRGQILVQYLLNADRAGRLRRTLRRAPATGQHSHDEVR